MKAYIDYSRAYNKYYVTHNGAIVYQTTSYNLAFNKAVTINGGRS